MTNSWGDLAWERRRKRSALAGFLSVIAVAMLGLGLVVAVGRVAEPPSVIQLDAAMEKIYARPAESSRPSCTVSATVGTRS